MPPLTHFIRLPQPCQESWAAMTPTPAGRHCAACQKVVVDFTQKTDAEILAYLAGVAGPACGRFRAGQLTRPLRPAAPEAPRRRTWLAALVAAGGALGAGRAMAQTTGSGYFSAGPTPTPAAQPATPAAALPPASALAATPSLPAASAAVAEVRGVVTDSTTGEPLPGVTVLLMGTTHSVFTDAEGTFVLPLPAEAKTLRLAFSSIGYVSQQQTASAHGHPPLAVALAADTRPLMGEVVMVGAYETIRPWPWHPRRLYHWTKYQLGRPFRR